MADDEQPAAALPDRIARPHPERFSPEHPGYDAVIAAHTAAVLGDVDGYVDPVSGYWVFTARYLDERGHCCDQGCRHCPWVERA